MKLPIGVQDFAKIREEDYLYIDKTKYLYDLITSTDYAFLSRPRRFGKSLFVSTLKYLFQGKKELFKGLAIYDKYDFPSHPVIHIAFGGARSEKELFNTIRQNLERNSRAMGIEYPDYDDVAVCFADLIEKAYEKYNQKVAILIDEYDKPILDNIDQMEIARGNRDILRRLYTEIKNNDPYIRFAFLTGVTKFSKAGIFSGLNNLKDITLYAQFGNLLGITQDELEEYFGEVFRENGVDFDKVREWYNGYNFLGDLVYNPFDLLLFVDNGINSGKFRFKPYWFSTGTPKFLIDIIDKGDFYIPEIAGLKIGDTILDSFDIDNILPESILFQAGYLTIDEEIINEEEEIEYLLRLPNKEVRSSLSKVLIEYLTNNLNTERRSKIHISLKQSDMDGLRKELEALLASIPYHNYTRNDISQYEGYYASVIYAYLQSLGYEIRGEDVTNIGRADITMIMKDKIYIFEIKVNTEESPIKQIKERQYYKKYEKQNKPIYLVGITIDRDKRNIVAFEWERVIRKT